LANNGDSLWRGKKSQNSYALTMAIASQRRGVDCKKNEIKERLHLATKNKRLKSKAGIMEEILLE
jgi:hypothetical protein